MPPNVRTQSTQRLHRDCQAFKSLSCRKSKVVVLGRLAELEGTNFIAEGWHRACYTNEDQFATILVNGVEAVVRLDRGCLIFTSIDVLRILRIKLIGVFNRC